MSPTSTVTGGAVLKAHNVAYAIEKIGDFFRGTGSGILAGWPETSAKIIVEALQELSVKLASAGVTPEATSLPMAIYTARELQKYLKPAPSDIPNRDAARVYYRCLRSLIRELSQVDKEIAERFSGR
ncbi:MAG TPA: hypothetical protein VFK81_16380 [Terriglobales bacterium]|nr:hypothetical protein [Terriglobales bacterium]